MHEKLRLISERFRSAVPDLMERARRALNGGAGYYGALALLLILLALASGAYRARAHRAKIDVTDVPRAAIAVRQSEEDEPVIEAPQWVLPLEGDVIGEFSPDEPVWSETLGQWQSHPGLDIAGTPGEAVYACADGVVSDAWNDRLWGNTIVIDHGNGYVSTYAGVNTLKLVDPGAAVAAGEVISAVGLPAGCESCLAAHLHFELKLDDQPKDIRALIASPDRG